MKTREFIEHIIINGVPCNGTREYLNYRKNKFLDNNLDLRKYIEDVIELLRDNEDELLDSFKNYLNDNCGCSYIRNYLNFFVDEYNLEYEPIDTVNHIYILLKVYKKLFCSYKLKFNDKNKMMHFVCDKWIKHYEFNTPVYLNEFGTYSISLNVYEKGVRSPEITFNSSNRIIKQAFELFSLYIKLDSFTNKFISESMNRLIENGYIEREKNKYSTHSIFNDDKLYNFKELSFSLVDENSDEKDVSKEYIIKLNL